MSLHDICRLVYFADTGKKENSKKKDSLSDEQLGRILETVARQSMKERTPDLNELESAIQNALKSAEQDGAADSKDTDESDGSAAFTKMLQNSGYLRDSKNWLTRKGFLEIGGKILGDLMKNLSPSEFGLHETSHSGDGGIIIDTTKKFEPGDDVRYLSAQQTVLNAIQRTARKGHHVKFPLSVEPDDLEEFETLQDTSAAIVYCIDLSSTMRTKLGGNLSRIEAAKRALWSLYMLNRKFFPNDSVFVVGFASLASKVSPFDIPFLKTFDSSDNFLHYTNYQAALRMSRRILQKTAAQNKRIVLITDGQPSACFVENESQKNDIISDKPYSNFHAPEKTLLAKMKQERNMGLDASSGLVYLCYRYKKVDPKIEKRTIIEAKKCIAAGIGIDSIVVSEERELLDYVKGLERDLGGKTYHIETENMDRVLVTDYLSNSRKVFSKKQNW